ncbi:Ephrin type-A receptor 3 [Geodia barretti]|uniref:Ephrin type-A receptor 3 n=1 Tax=Geodia barretti TaxID=519541 RepID=A0AA35VZ03_GEOBA|nr:Ephrin type-A receptor 3 [Geodia barretti]
MADTGMGRIAAAVFLWILASGVIPSASASDGFASLEVIRNPGPRVMHADSFQDQRVLWLFPFLNFTQSRSITGWAFRAQSSQAISRMTTENMPLFQLWQETTATDTLDYRCIKNCNQTDGLVESVQEIFTGSSSVYKQTLVTPLEVSPSEHFILGVLLPSSEGNHLNLAFQNDEMKSADRRSYFFSSMTRFVAIREETYRDNLHIPLVTPLYDEAPSITTPDRPTKHTSSVPHMSAGTVAVFPVGPSRTSSSTQPNTSTAPTLSTLPPNTSPSSSQPPIALIIGAVIIGLVVLTLLLLVPVLLLKYHQLRLGKRRTHLDNPTYEVSENGAAKRSTAKSNTSSNGSYPAYANPAQPTFLSATLPPLTSHQVSPHIPPPLILHHYEIDENRQSRVYDQPNLRAATMPPPLPYEVPMAPTREPSTTKHHVYSELECGEAPSLSTTLQEDKKSLISGSQTSSIFDNSIYKDPNHLVPNANGNLEGNDDLYWKPASSTRLLYDQLSHRKFPEILRDNIRLTEHLGSGQFGTVNKGVWQSPSGPVMVAIKQLQLRAAELDRVRFLQEAAIMGQFYHPNVVTLHGVVTKDDPIMIVLEFMSNGDLRNSLLKIRPLPHEPVPETLPLLLLRFCQEVATGMAYLSKKAFVHRDLAARNILLDSNSTCKIGDFGMSRDLEDSDYYITHGGIIPVKWTAPEALHYKKYSTASDVWSFGCLMYEIWSLGHKPFEQYGNMDCIQLVSQGCRLPPPAGCCRALYKLMILCWHKDPSQRPVFSEMQHVLTHLNTQLLEKVDPRLGRLGGPLEAGDGVYPDLQDYYLQDQSDSSSDSR